MEKFDAKENNENNNFGSESSIRIITDEPINNAPDFKKYTNQLSKLIVYSIPRFTVGIYGGWGTGKTTFMRMIKHEIDQKYSDNVETVWFDAWRYEKEQYSAMVPLLRTINLSLRNTIQNSKDSKKKNILTRIEGHVSKLGGAILRHTTVNVAANIGAGSGGAQSDIGKIIDDYKSDGSVIHGQERIYFHKHITDHLQEELYKIRKEYDFRIVIFVDDLDRCTPERALERDRESLEKLSTLVFSRFTDIQLHLSNFLRIAGIHHLTEQNYIVNNIRQRLRGTERYKSIGISDEIGEVLDVIWKINHKIQELAYPEPLQYNLRNFEYRKDDWRKLLEIRSTR